MKKRYVNFRILFVVAIMLALGVFFARKLIGLDIATIIISTLIVGAFIAWAVITKDVKKFLISFFAFLVGVGMFLIVDSSFLPKDFVEENYEVSGRVESVYYNNARYQAFVVEDVKLDGLKQNRKVIITMNKTSESIKVGDIIEFSAYISKVDMWELGEYNSYYYKNNIAFCGEVSQTDVSVLDSKPSFTDKFKDKVKNVLYENMTEDNASVAYAAIFGDKSGIDKEVKQSFSNLGVAHLLAISGLHIGFFVALLTGILSLCKLKKKWHVLVILPILIIYCYLCNFSSSVVRATIMATVLMIGRALGKKNDALTSMSFALILILFVRPMMVFDGGTQLSFLSVFSIILLQPTLSKVFRKIKLGKFSELLATTLAVQIGVMPIIIKMFGSFSILTIPANFICIPLFEVAYIALMIFIPFAFISPLGVLLYVPEFLINTICFGVLNLAKVNSLNITSGYLGSIFTIMYIAIMFSLSRFVMSGKLTRALIVCSLVFLTSLLMFTSSAQNQVDTNSIITLKNHDGIYIVADENLNCYVVDCFGEYNNAQEDINLALRQAHLNKIDYIVTFEEQNFNIDYQNKNAEKIYSKTNLVEYLTPLDEPKGMVLTLGDKKIAFLKEIKNDNEKENMKYLIKDCQFDWIVNLSGEETSQELGKQIPISDKGNFTINLNYDKFGKRRCLD